MTIFSASPLISKFGVRLLRDERIAAVKCQNDHCNANDARLFRRNSKLEELAASRKKMLRKTM